MFGIIGSCYCPFQSKLLNLCDNKKMLKRSHVFLFLLQCNTQWLHSSWGGGAYMCILIPIIPPSPTMNLLHLHLLISFPFAKDLSPCIFYYLNFYFSLYSLGFSYTTNRAIFKCVSDAFQSTLWSKVHTSFKVFLPCCSHWPQTPELKGSSGFNLPSSGDYRNMPPCQALTPLNPT